MTCQRINCNCLYKTCLLLHMSHTTMPTHRTHTPCPRHARTPHPHIMPPSCVHRAGRGRARPRIHRLQAALPGVHGAFYCCLLPLACTGLSVHLLCPPCTRPASPASYLYFPTKLIVFQTLRRAVSQLHFPLVALHRFSMSIISPRVSVPAVLE